MESVWQRDSTELYYPKLKGTIKTQVLVVGGGGAFDRFDPGQ